MRLFKNLTISIVSFAVALPMLAMVFLSSCANDEVQRRTDERTDFFERIGENMATRTKARNERYDRQFDRIMN